MLTMPILIVVGVTPRNDAVSAGAAVVATAAGAVLAVGGANTPAARPPGPSRRTG